MALSDLAVKKARPREKTHTLSDERGLFLIVNPDGSKWWRLRFTFAGKRRLMSLGVYPDVELGDARKRRDEARKQIASGVDPVRARRAESADEAATFKATAQRWLEANRSRWCEHNYGVLTRRLERLIYPQIGSRDIRTIEPADMLKAIRKIEATGTTELPRRMNTICGSVFRFAIAEGLKARDPTHDIVDALKRKPPVKHLQFIRPEHMGEFLVKITDDKEEDRDTIDALRLLMLTAGRTGEIRFAAVEEFEQLDGKQPLWRIPKERMKMRKEHLVPLPRQAADLVRGRIATRPRGQSLLFGRYTRSSVLSENTMLFALYRFGYRGKATVHGFRSTFSTLANEATADGSRLWHPDWIERALAHVPANQVRGAYNAAEYLPERRRLLQWWADWLDREYETARLIG